MEKGDTFIYYGNTPNSMGKVLHISEKTVYDIKNRVKVIRVFIVSEDGIKYDAKDCLKVKGSILPNFIKKLKSIF